MNFSGRMVQRSGADVELHQLQCFIAVLEEGGFKRATARLGITQPALSYQIKRLEEELGVQLFHRRPGSATEAGRVFLGHAQEVIAMVREAHQAVRELSDGVTGEIRIGSTYCVGTYFLPRVLWELRAKHPLVRPQIQYRVPDELLEALLANKLDVAVVPEPAADRRLKYEQVMEERFSLVSGLGHPFYGRSTVAAAELEDVPFVTLAPHTSSGAAIRRYLDRLGLSVAQAVSVDNAETAKRMVEAGMGVAFLPDMATAEDVAANGGPGRLSRSATDPPLTRSIAMVRWIDSGRSLALDAFIEEVRRIAARARAPEAP
jgi:DNA-binding transcriptional LysR family regulator